MKSIPCALAPSLQLQSLLEVVLPDRVASIPFVREQIHPSVAQVQSFLGYAEARPTAPTVMSMVGV